MKKILLIANCLVGLNSAFAQVHGLATPNGTVDNSFTTWDPGRSNKYFSQNDINGSQFFPPTWALGTITTISNETYPDRYFLLLDKVAQKLYIKTKDADSNTVILADKEQLSSFTINTDKPHLFVLSNKYGVSKKNNFLEVLVKNDSGYALLKLVTTTYVKADTHNMLNAINGNNKSSYVDETSYYISYKNGPLQKVELKEKSFKNVLINKELAVQNYFAQAGKKDKNEQFYINLIQSVNN